MKKTLIIMALTLGCALPAMSQEVTAYDATDSTAYYNALYNPNNYAQAPIKGPQRKVNNDRNRLHTNVNMGVGVGGGGSYEYLNPSFNYDLSKRWSLNFGMGVAYSTLKLNNLSHSEDAVHYHNIRAISNYYSVGATYRATDKLSVYGDIIYAKTMPIGDESPFGGNRDAYMATFGATYNITKSLSVGFEVRQSRNMNPYGIPGSPYGIIYNNPYSPW